MQPVGEKRGNSREPSPGKVLHELPRAELLRKYLSLVKSYGTNKGSIYAVVSYKQIFQKMCQMLPSKGSPPDVVSLSEGYPPDQDTCSSNLQLPV